MLQLVAVFATREGLKVMKSAVLWAATGCFLLPVWANYIVAIIAWLQASRPYFSTVVFLSTPPYSEVLQTPGPKVRLVYLKVDHECHNIPPYGGIGLQFTYDSVVR